MNNSLKLFALQELASWIFDARHLENMTAVITGIIFYRKIRILYFFEELCNLNPAFGALDHFERTFQRSLNCTIKGLCVVN